VRERSCGSDFSRDARRCFPSLLLCCFSALLLERFAPIGARMLAGLLIPRHPCEGRGPVACAVRDQSNSRDLPFRLQSVPSSYEGRNALKL